MAEQNNESTGNWTKAEDVAQETALNAGRAETLLQKRSATAESSQESPDNESDNDDSAVGQEINLNAIKSQAAARLAQKAATEAAKKVAQVATRAAMSVAASVASAVGGAIVATFWIWGPLLLLIFLFGIPYYYWTQHKWNPSLYWNVFTGNYVQLFTDAINDTPSPPYTGTPTPAAKTVEAPATPAAANTVPGNSLNTQQQ